MVHESPLSESESALFFIYRRPQGIYAGLTSKLQREQTTGTPPFCFPSVTTENPKVRKSGAKNGVVRSDDDADDGDDGLHQL